MNLLKLIDICKKKVPGGWSFFLSTTLPQNAGECDLLNKIIRINSRWAKDIPDAQVIKVLAEEIKHAKICSKCKKIKHCAENYHCSKLKKRKKNDRKNL